MCERYRENISLLFVKYDRIKQKKIDEKLSMKNARVAVY